MSITFSTSWYIFKAKFDVTTYFHWIDNMLSNVNNYNLVIYSDDAGSQMLQKYLQNPRIKLIIKPYEQFYTYRYKDFWIKNHERNEILREWVDWKVNMLWCEKVHFVYETMQQQYFSTDYYGWCDIGYFRGRNMDLNKDELRDWPSYDIVNNLNRKKIYYACIKNNNEYMRELISIIQDKNVLGLPNQEIPAHQNSIAGGFFIAHKDKIEWWRDTFNERLLLYFQNNYLVKDDQIIIVDCIFSNLKHFCLCKEENPKYDNWFLFQRYFTNKIDD